MATRQDFLLDKETYEDIIENGDFAVGIADNDNVKLLISYVKGHFKQDPTVGAGYITSKNGVITDIEIQKIKTELLRDGYMVSLIKYNQQTNNLDIKYD